MVPHNQHKAYGFDNLKVPDNYIHIDDVDEKIKEVRVNSYLSVWQLSSFESDELKTKIANEILTFYRSMEAIDDSGNMTVCLSKARYYGNDYGLYGIIISTIKSDIYDKISKLPTQDLVVLFDDIETTAEDWVMDIESWEYFRKALFKTDEIEDIINQISQMIFQSIPEYFPYED